MFGSKFATAEPRISGFTVALESAVECDPSRYGVVVDMASQLRNMLLEDGVSLSIAEKMTVLKSLTRAKLRALRNGAKDNYRMFKTLDTISSDLVQLL